MNKRLLILFIAAALIAAGAWIWFSRKKPESGSGKPGGPSVAGDNSSASGDGKAGDPKKDAKTEKKARPAVAGLSPEAQKIYDAIHDALDELKSKDPARVKAALDKLDELLGGEGHNADASIAAIVAFLKTGLDSPTGEDFVVGPKGVLANSNTLRVFLLDQLGGLCVEANNTAALEVAREILGKFGSPDEWAVSMRNMAWLDPNSKTTLAAKMNEMLNHEQWVNDPSRGYLEAFDFVVHTGAANLIPNLQDFLKLEETNPLWRASAVALDRLAQQNPNDIMNWLNANPNALKDDMGRRADLFAKADITKPDHRSQIEAYLGRTDVTPDEKGQFLQKLTSPGSFISDNLVTPPPNPTTPEIEAGRLAALNKMGQEWVGADKFPDLKNQLGEFLNQTKPPAAEDDK